MNGARKKKIVIDARPLARPRSGIRRYLENIIVHLLKHREVEWILYSDFPLVSDVVDGLGPHKLRVIGPGRYARLLWGWQVRRWLKQDQPDVYWTPRHHLPFFLPDSVRSLVTIHDMVWVTLPETMRPTGLWAERFATGRSLAQADSIIAVSQSTASDIASFEAGVQEKITILTHGSTRLPAPTTNQKLRYGDYMLSVGTIEPRKNYPRLIKAYLSYRKSGGQYKLIIVGSKGWGWADFQRARENPALVGMLHHIESCNDEELSALYHDARSFVSVALGEGYGLPVMEAAGYGLPMILSDIDVFHEHPLDRVCWVNPCDTTAISSAMMSLEEASTAAVGHVNTRPALPSWRSVSAGLFQLLVSD